MPYSENKTVVNKSLKGYRNINAGKVLIFLRLLTPNAYRLVSWNSITILGDKVRQFEYIKNVAVFHTYDFK